MFLKTQETLKFESMIESLSVKGVLKDTANRFTVFDREDFTSKLSDFYVKV